MRLCLCGVRVNVGAAWFLSFEQHYCPASSVALLTQSQAASVLVHDDVQCVCLVSTQLVSQPTGHMV